MPDEAAQRGRTRSWPTSSGPRSATPWSTPGPGEGATSGSGSTWPGWREAAEAAEALGLTYFCYLSAIDWLPSPFGKSEETACAHEADDVRARMEGASEPRARASPAARPASSSWPACPVARRAGSPSRPTCPTTALAVRPGPASTPAPTGTSGRPGDVRHRLRRPPVPRSTCTCPAPSRASPAAQGLPAPRPRGEALAGPRRRRADARRGRRARSRATTGAEA